MQEQKYINTIPYAVTAEASYVLSKDTEELKSQLLEKFENAS